MTINCLYEEYDTLGLLIRILKKLTAKKLNIFMNIVNNYREKYLGL